MDDWKKRAEEALAQEDWPKYFRFLKVGADSEDTEAMWDWGLWLLEGKEDVDGSVVLRRSLRDGARWVARAAERSHPGALNSLASCYDSGEGVRKNKHRALDLYRRAVRAGEEDAAINVAITYRELGNMRAYRRWLERAARGGNPEGILQLAEWTLTRRTSSTRKRKATASLRKLVRRLQDTPPIQQYPDELPRAKELLRRAESTKRRRP